MQPIYTFNDTSIEIQIIEKGCYYKANIPNNEANKMLIENTIFKFEKSGSVIIMHDNNNVFQLYKMECNYSDYIEMQNKLEHLKNENDILNNKITDKNQLQQQLNIYYEEQIDRLKKELNNNNDLIQQQIKILKNKSIADKKEVILLKQELSKNEKELVNFKNDLLQEMKNEMVQLKNELFDTNKLFVKEIEKVNDKSVEVSKDMEQLNNNLQKQIKLSIHQFNKDINLPFVFIMSLTCTQSTRTYYATNQNRLIYHNARDYFNLREHIPYLFSQQDVKGLLTYGSEECFCINTCRTRYLYERIIIPSGKVLILINLSTTIKIYNKGIHDNIKTSDIVMLINEKDIDNILALWKKVQVNQNLIITQIESTYVKE